MNHQPLPEAIITHFANDNTALIQEFGQNARLLEKYTPPTDITALEFKLVILRSQDTIDTEALCGVEYDWLSCQNARDEAVTGWMRLLSRTPKIFEIPGNHFEPFAAQNVSFLNPTPSPFLFIVRS